MARLDRIAYRWACCNPSGPRDGRGTKWSHPLVRPRSSNFRLVHRGGWTRRVEAVVRKAHLHCCRTKFSSAAWSLGTVAVHQTKARELYNHANEHRKPNRRSEEHTSELQSLMRISYAVFCLKKKKT